MEFQHKSVLLQECIDALNIRPDGIYLDGTLGGAGHSSQIARRLTEGGRLIGVDRDRAALAAAKERLAPYADRVTLVHSNFAEIDAILDSLGIPAVDGMLFDLGVSSPQLDDASRGFSYMADAPLDMRMDKDDALTAGAGALDPLARMTQLGRGDASSMITARSAMRRRSRQPSAGRVRRHPSKRRWSWWTSSARPCPRRRCAKSSTPPKEAFRPSASP